MIIPNGFLGVWNCPNFRAYPPVLIHPEKCALGLSAFYLQQGQNALKSFKFSLLLPSVLCSEYQEIHSN